MSGCFLVKIPTVAVVYVYPSGRPQWDDNARNFSATYRAHPANHGHLLCVVLNGTHVKGKVESVFEGLHYQTIQHDNTGWDIGAFQKAARSVPCDLMVFLGSSAYIRVEGWLKRMVEAYQLHGNAQYGATGNRGNGPVHPHIRTTGFWMEPDLMNAYPVRVVRPEQRYPFEHGSGCFTDWVTSLGLESWVVSTTGEYLWPDWDLFPNGYHRGDQSTMLVGDRLTAPPFYHVP